MRLIDADELMEKIHSVKYLRKIKSKQLIDECKRIDAIPIEWILRYLFDHPINYFDSLKLYIVQMIQDWRE